MRNVKITVIRKVCHEDLIELYENPITDHCSMKVGDIFVTDGCKMPIGFCSSAWGNIEPYVSALVYGENDFYDGWMKKKGTAMISCNDGFRPVSFLLEAIDER